MKEQKNEFILWLCILGLVGVFIFFMPDIERFIFGQAKKDKTPKTEEKKEEPKKEEKTTKNGSITCGSEISENSTMEYVINYEDSKAKKVVMKVNTIYTTKDSMFEAAKTECNKVATKYANQKGFVAKCEVDNMTIRNEQQFDLATFKETTVTDSDGNTETISLDIKLDDNIKDVTNNLKTMGLTCK